MVKHIIFNTDALFDEDAYNEWKKEAEEYGDFYNEGDWYDEVWSWLDDERANLNKELDGVVVGYANLGLWDGNHIGAKILGHNVNSFLNPIHSDYPEFYSDGYNIRSTLPHHDGVNTVLYRIAKDRETAEKLVERIAYDRISEKQFCRVTKSLNPYVSEIYGWPYRKRKGI